MRGASPRPPPSATPSPPRTVRGCYRGTAGTTEPSRVEDVHRADLRDILVSSPAHAQQAGLVHGPTAALRRDPGDGVGRLQRRNDPFQPAQKLKSLQRLVIRNRHVLRTAAVLEERVLRTDAGIVEARRD